MSKIVAVTVEVVTRSTATFEVEIPDGFSGNGYNAIGQALFEKAPSMLFSDTTRSMHRAHFKTTDAPATLVAVPVEEGRVELRKKADLVELTLSDCQDLDDDPDTVFILCCGTDENGNEVVTSPLKIADITGGTLEVVPFTEAAIEIAKSTFSRSFGGITPESLGIAIECDSTVDPVAALKLFPYACLRVKANKKRHEFSIATWDEFSRDLRGRYALDDSEFSSDDLVHAYFEFAIERGVAVEPEAE